MSDALAQIREDVANALVAVLPGRVRPYRPDHLAANAGPTIWVERVDTTQSATPAATDVEVTIIAVVDGASHAAQAMRDHLHCGIHDAVAAAGLRWISGTSTSIVLSADVTALAVEALAAGVVYTTTLCPPEPVESVPIPVVPVEVYT